MCYCLAAERLIGLEVPKRAQYIRVLLTEVDPHRFAPGLAGHAYAIDMGAMSVFLYSFREARRDHEDFREYVSGQRMMTSYFRIGGLALECLTPDLLDRVRPCVIDALPAHIDEYETLLTENRIWMGRTQGIGILGVKDAIAMGVSGPLLRARRTALMTIRKAFPLFELRRV